ncbi:MAG: hypothetical protein ABH811_01125 [archaeon]
MNVKEVKMGLKDLFKELIGTLEGLPTIYLIIVGLILFILIILTIIEKILRRKIKIRKSSIDPYLKKIKKIKKTKPKETLQKIDDLAIQFFRERFDIKHATEYSELRNFFNQKKDKQSEEFCNRMNDVLYSGKNTNKEINQDLILRLTQIINDNPKKDKEDKLKESQKLKSKLKNIKIPSINKKKLNSK